MNRRRPPQDPYQIMRESLREETPRQSPRRPQGHAGNDIYSRISAPENNQPSRGGMNFVTNTDQRGYAQPPRQPSMRERHARGDAVGMLARDLEHQ